MKTTTAVDDYNANRGILITHAWSYCRNTGVDFDEAMSIANLAFFEARRTFNRDHGTRFQTHLWHYVKGHFMKEHKRMKRYHDTISLLEPNNIESVVPTRDMTARLNFHHELDSMSKRARRALSLVLSNPCDFVDIPRATMTRTFVYQLGWTWHHSKITIQEIKDKLKSY